MPSELAAEEERRERKPWMKTQGCGIDMKHRYAPDRQQMILLFSILCLTTDPIHQGHEKRKKSVTSARSPRNTSAQLCDRKVWEAVTSCCLGNGRSDASCKQYGGVSAWYKQFSVSASYKQYVSDECTSRQKHNMLYLLHAACLKLLDFFVLLTVHLSIILAVNQLVAQNLLL